MREIFTVKAMQVVTSDLNPQGIYQAMPNYPKLFDSRSYKATEENPNGDDSIALKAAKAEYFNIGLQLATADAPQRVMWTITLERSDGRNILSDSWGHFPDMTPQPAPELEAEPIEE